MTHPEPYQLPSNFSDMTAEDLRNHFLFLGRLTELDVTETEFVMRLIDRIRKRTTNTEIRTVCLLVYAKLGLHLLTVMDREDGTPDPKDQALTALLEYYRAAEAYELDSDDSAVWDRLESARAQLERLNVR